MLNPLVALPQSNARLKGTWACCCGEDGLRRFGPSARCEYLRGGRSRQPVCKYRPPLRLPRALSARRTAAVSGHASGRQLHY